MQYHRSCNQTTCKSVFHYGKYRVNQTEFVESKSDKDSMEEQVYLLPNFKSSLSFIKMKRHEGFLFFICKKN